VALCCAAKLQHRLHPSGHRSSELMFGFMLEMVHALSNEAFLQPGIYPYDAQSTDFLNNSSAQETVPGGRL
jgi:hypothetical protein